MCALNVIELKCNAWLNYFASSVCCNNESKTNTNSSKVRQDFLILRRIYVCLIISKIIYIWNTFSQHNKNWPNCLKNLFESKFWISLEVMENRNYAYVNNVYFCYGRYITSATTTPQSTELQLLFLEFVNEMQRIELNSRSLVQFLC